MDGTQERGWYFDLPLSHERLVARPILRNEYLIVATMIPSVGLGNTGGPSWLMTLDTVTGNRLPHPAFDRNDDGVIDDGDWVTAMVEGVTQQRPPSGMAFNNGVVSMPVILQARPFDQMYSHSTVGGSERVRRHPGHGARGRQAWRRLS